VIQHTAVAKAATDLGCVPTVLVTEHPPASLELGGDRFCAIDLLRLIFVVGDWSLPHSRAAFRFSFLTAVLVGILSCEDSGGGLNEPTTGTLEVTTATTGVETDPDGYSLQVDSDSPQAIGSAASWQSGNLAEGSHTITLSGMAANCVVEGENPRTVSITAGETATVSFAITCGATTGSLRVTAATAGPSPDIDGYQLTLDGVDRGTIGPTAETTLEGLTTGAHTIGLAGVAGNCLVEGENPRAVTITAGGTATADFVVTCQTPPASTGSIHISTATSGSGTDPDGYQFQIDGSGTQPIASSGEATVSNVAVGAHSVLLAGVVGHCTVAGANPQSVSVTAGGTAEVAFSVTCQTTPTGSIEVRTTTTGSGLDPDGYTFTVASGAAQSIGANATVSSGSLAPGNYSVQLAGVAGNCTLEGTNPRAVTVTANNTTQVAFAITCTAPANRLGLVTQPSAQAQSGVVLARQPVVRLEDANGTLVGTSGISVVASLASGGGTLGGTTTVQTGADGQATYADLVITGSAGEYTIHFEAPGSGYTGVTSEAVIIGSSNAGYQITELDFIPVAINDLGHVAGVRGGFFSPTAQAVIWREGVSTNLGTLGGPTSQAVAINEHDVVVGSSTTSSGKVHGFLWDGTMHDLGPDFVPSAINDAGQMVGSPYGHANTLFRDGDQTVGMGGCNSSGLNNLGQAVGQWLRPPDDEPNVCMWDGEVHDLDLDDARGTDINDRGEVVGIVDHLTSRAFHLRNGQRIPLQNLGGETSRASAISESGVVVGSSSEVEDDDRAPTFPVVWNEGIVTKLSQEYGRASDINSSGWIVGAITPEVGVVPPRGVLWRPLAAGN
jgi:probable HAF family extracellular repeat protein